MYWVVNNVGYERFVESVRDEGREHVADVMIDDQIGYLVELGRVAIDNDKASAVALGDQREAGGWPDDQRRPDRDEKIARLCKLLRPAHRHVGHRLTERYRRRLDEAAAVRTVGRATVGAVHPAPHPGKLIPLGAVDAGRIGGVTVQLDH